MANDPFAPPPEDKRPLELETEWGQQKAAKQATAVVHEPARKRRNSWIWLGLGLVVAAVVAAGVYVQLHAKKRPVSHDVNSSTVEIEILSNKPAMITVDGHKAGKAPLTLHVQKGTTPIQISNGRTIQTVVPDRDQTVDFTR